MNNHTFKFNVTNVYICVLVVPIRLHGRLCFATHLIRLIAEIHWTLCCILCAAVGNHTPSNEGHFMSLVWRCKIPLKFFTVQADRGIHALLMNGEVTFLVRNSETDSGVLNAYGAFIPLPDWCGQNIHKSKNIRRFHFVQFYTVCLLYSYVFSVRTGQQTEV